MSRIEDSAFLQATTYIAGWRRPLLLSHAKPDGDALGSLAAMRSLFPSAETEPTALLFDVIPRRYVLFDGLAPLEILGRNFERSRLDEHDGVIVLDTCAYSQLGPVADWLRASRLPKLAIDHHVTRDDLADRYLIDESAAAASLILYEWAVATDRELPPNACDALFVGIAMDTGWFKHSNTDDRVLCAAADLTARGVSPHTLHQQLYQRETAARVRLLGAAIGTLELRANDRFAIMTVSLSDLAAAHAGTADTEDVVNEPLRIDSVEVSVLLTETPEKEVRASFRSKPPIGDGSDVDVAAIAAGFGGGGHRRAAGARFSKPLAEAREAVIQRVEQKLAN